MSRKLKDLAEALKISEGFLKGLVKGKNRDKDDFIRTNTANACKAVAKWTGYKSEQAARKAITIHVNMLYISDTVLAKRIEQLLPKFGKAKRAILSKAVAALKSSNYTEFNKLIKSDKSLASYRRKCAKSLKKEWIDKLRSSPKANKSTAKAILISAKSPNGAKIVVPHAKLEKEIERRVKRYGAVASLFWQAAKQINPKIKGGGLSKEKKKKHKATNGAGFSTSEADDAISASIKHQAEINRGFKAKITKTVQQQEKYWAKQAEKQILASKYLNKLIDK